MEEEIDYVRAQKTRCTNNLHLKPTLPTRANLNGGKQGTTVFAILKDIVRERKTLCKMAAHDFTRRRTEQAVNPRDDIECVLTNCECVDT